MDLDLYLKADFLIITVQQLKIRKEGDVARVRPLNKFTQMLGKDECFEAQLGSLEP